MIKNERYKKKVYYIKFSTWNCAIIGSKIKYIYIFAINRCAKIYKQIAFVT